MNTACSMLPYESINHILETNGGDMMEFGSTDRYIYFSFPTSERPRGMKTGDQIELDLIEKEEAKRVYMTVTVTYLENVPGGYMMDAKTVIGGQPYILNVYVGSDSRADFVKMFRNLEVPVWGKNGK